jgi:putative redox protein
LCGFIVVFVWRLVESCGAHLPCEGEAARMVAVFVRFNSLPKGTIKMVAIQIEYEGELHCKAVHGPSGTELSTDAPTDNQGRGESFSPTDLLATALGTCMLTVMGIMARTLAIDIGGTTATVEKQMTAAPPRMIESLTVKIHVPHSLSAEDRQKLEAAAHTCPVHKSLHPSVKTPIEFSYS